MEILLPEKCEISAVGDKKNDIDNLKTKILCIAGYKSLDENFIKKFLESYEKRDAIYEIVSAIQRIQKIQKNIEKLNTTLTGFSRIYQITNANYDTQILDQYIYLLRSVLVFAKEQGEDKLEKENEAIRKNLLKFEKMKEWSDIKMSNEDLRIMINDMIETVLCIQKNIKENLKNQKTQLIQNLQRMNLSMK